MLIPRRRLRWRAIPALALALALVPSPCFADRAMPLEATVLVRLIGHVRILRGADDRVWREKLVELRQVEVGTGSGFIITPQGLVVTNHHVIRGEKFIVSFQGQKFDVAIDVAGIEVVVPADSSGRQRRYPASVAAADPELDLALLQINAVDLPYMALGDSDALMAGDLVNAVGYPFGGTLDLEKPNEADIVPSPSMSNGVVSGFRNDAPGDRRYLQLTAPLYPGSSGGAVVDSEGYAVGVAQLRAENASAIGFAIPINRVKRLIEINGLDSTLPVALLSPGAVIADPRKGVNVQVPAGFEDRSPLRLRVEATAGIPHEAGITASSEDLALRIDRVATAQSMDQLERALLAEGMLERFHATSQSRTRNNRGARRLTGHASGTDAATGNPLKLVYTIVDLGKEKIVARYVGPADSIAANRSLLHTSLSEIEISPLLSAEVMRAIRPTWTSPARSGTGVIVPTVEGWIVEPSAPWRCAAGLPPPSAGLAMSPVGDFTVALRAAWHDTAINELTSVARNCSPQPGAFGESSYGTRAVAWGVDYQIDGVFVQLPGSGVWQLEMITPVEKGRLVQNVFSEWIQTIQR